MMDPAYLTGVVNDDYYLANLSGELTIHNVTDNRDDLHITGAGIVTINQTIEFLNGTDYRVKLSHAATDNRVVTFPDATFTIGGLGLSQTWTSTNQFDGAVLVKAGTAANPSVALTTNGDTGWYFPSATSIATIVDATTRLLVDSSGISVTGAIDATTTVRGTAFVADGDPGAGTAGTTILTNSTVGSGFTPGASADAIKIWVGTTQYKIPVYAIS